MHVLLQVKTTFLVFYTQCGHVDMKTCILRHNYTRWTYNVLRHVHMDKLVTDVWAQVLSTWPILSVDMWTLGQWTTGQTLV